MSDHSSLSAETLAPIRALFFQECEELLADLETGLLALDCGKRDPDIVNSVFRAVHSIKGGATTFGSQALVRFAHLFETVMEEVRRGRMALQDAQLKLLLRASDQLADHVRAARDDDADPETGPIEAALALLIGEGAEAAPDIAGDEDEDDLPGLAFLPSPVTFKPLWDESARADGTWEGFMPSPAAPPAALAPTPAAPAESLRVDLDRINRLTDLAGELVIGQAMLAEQVWVSGVTPESGVGLALEELTQLTRKLQDSVMAMRAQSVKSVFQRMSRLVRDLEASTGKSVGLCVSGETTEVDRTVIERLTDPLTHMVRNAIDHGVESPERRLAAGKPARGTLRISAAHRAGRIMIEVADDGGGIDRERVRAAAVERGLISAQAALSDEEIDDLIFQPGFSTASSISDLSGRGVGLDVVRRGVQALGGRIALSSKPGEGSTFTLSLPLTLAVLDGMLVRVAGQNLVVPLTAMVESVQSGPADIRRLGPKAELLTYRGEPIAVVDLAEALGYRAAAPTAPRRVALVVEDGAGRRLALLVDDILDQRQLVIKSLEANYRRVAGVAAATILGDGRVALILDVDALIAAQIRQSAAPERLAKAG